MEDERDGEAENPGPPKQDTGPRRNLTFDKRRALIEDLSTDDDDDASDTSSLEVLQDDFNDDQDPGPHIPWTSDDIPSETVLFESGNCTSFRKHMEHIAERKIMEQPTKKRRYQQQTMRG